MFVGFGMSTNCMSLLSVMDTSMNERPPPWTIIRGIHGSLSPPPSITVRMDTDTDMPVTDVRAKQRD